MGRLSRQQLSRHLPEYKPSSVAAEYIAAAVVRRYRPDIGNAERKHSHEIVHATDTTGPHALHVNPIREVICALDPAFRDIVTTMRGLGYPW